MHLQNVQLDFANALITGEELPGATQSENLVIYQNSSLSAMRYALFEVYPLICKLVGKEFFDVLAKDYIKKYPSRSPNLQEYGLYFSDYVSHHPALKNLVYLSEVAKFEWACHTVYYAADANPAPIHVLKSIPPEKYPMLRITLNPACELIKFYYPILDIIDLCEGRCKEVNINAGSVHLLIIRRDLEIKLVSLSAADFTFLQCLQEGGTLAAAIQDAQVHDSHFDIQVKLPAWIKDKTMVGFVW